MDEQNLSNLSLYESFLNESEEIVNEPLASKEDVDKESVIEEEKGLTLYESFLNESENALPLKQETKKLSTPSTSLYNSFLNEEKESEISFSREVAYGQAQEPTAIGSLKRIGQAAIASLSIDETYKEARKRIEDVRQDKIFEEFEEFKGRPETAGVIAGRISVGLADPVTFLMPWAKIAKLGKIASLTAGGTFGAADMALREEALYGEINPATVGLGFAFGAGGAQVGDMIGNVYARSLAKPVDETIEVVSKTGERVILKAKIKGESKTPILKEKDVKAAEKINKQVTVDAEESIINLGNITTKLDRIKDRRKEISEEVKRLKTKYNKKLTPEQRAKDEFAFSVPSLVSKKRKALTAEVASLNKEVKRIYLEELPDNLLDVFEKGILGGAKNGVMNESIARALVQETVRPLIGGIIGGAVGATFTEEGQGNTLMFSLAALGAFGGKMTKVIQSKPFEIVSKEVKDAITGETTLVYRRSHWNVMKSLTAGSHVQDLMAWSDPLVNFAGKMFKMQGGGVTLGKIQKDLSVEEEAIAQLASWRNRYNDLISQYDDDVLELAGKITNERNLKSKKYSFLTDADRASKKYKTAEKVSKEVDDFTLDFKKYAVERGLKFDDEAQYGLTQILKQSSIKLTNYDKNVLKLADAFYIQNSKEVGHKYYKPKGKAEIEKAKKNALDVAAEYLRTSTGARRTSIWAKETDDAIFQNHSLGKARNEEFVLNAARHFNKQRTLYDQEARALVSDLFEQNPAETLNLLINNTVNVAEFTKRFGAKGEGIQKLFKDIDRGVLLRVNKDRGAKEQYKNVKEMFNLNPSALKLAQAEKKKIKDSLEAYFKVYHADAMPTSETGQAIVTFLQTGLTTTRLTKVSIPSLGDWLQTITNSGWKASFKAAVSEIKLSKEGLALSGKRKQVNGRTIGKFESFWLRTNGTDNIVEREMSDVLLIGSGSMKNYQKKAVNFTRQFFEVVQLGRVTRIARNWAFDSGVVRALDISNLIAKNKTGFLKTKNALQKEMDSLGLGKEQFMYLSQFKNIKDAIDDPLAKTYLKKAGLKSADRDALIPTVGNRRLFSQSNNPYVKFLGSFLSWAQAKTSQTNALVSRIEEGDAALFLRIAAAIPLFMTVREAQVSLSTSEKYKEDVAAETKTQKIAEGILFAGLPTVWVEKLRNMIKFGGGMDSIAPVLGYMDDFLDIIRKPLEKITDEESDTFLEVLSATTKEAAEVVPFGKRVVSMVEGEETGTLDTKTLYSTGGLVKGKDDVPYTKDNPADRVNPTTGKPYSDQMARLGLAEGGGDMTRVDGTQKSLQGWLGPIKNNVTGKDMTEVSMGIGPEDNQKLIPLLVPTLNKKEIAALQNMKIEGNVKNIPQSIKDKAIQHAREREEQGLNIFYNGE